MGRLWPRQPASSRSTVRLGGVRMCIPRGSWGGYGGGVGGDMCFCVALGGLREVPGVAMNVLGIDGGLRGSLKGPVGTLQGVLEGLWKYLGCL